MYLEQKVRARRLGTAIEAMRRNIYRANKKEQNARRAAQFNLVRVQGYYL